jgi:tetratricopeptide (TPR) repeat protein
VAFWAFAEIVRGRIGAIEGDDPSTVADRLREALEEYVPDLAERDYLRPRLATLVGAADAAVPADGFARPDLFAAWRTFVERLAGAESSVTLVIEDLQWADDGLLDFLEHLLETVQVPVFILTLSRPELLQRRPQWGTGRRATSVYLEPLTAASMAAVVEGLVEGLPADVRDALVERAEGVPLYAVETVRALIDRDAVVPREGRYVLAPDAAERVDLAALSAPASLTALIAARLDALPALERRVVQDASVLGSSFSAAGLAAVTGNGDSAQVLDSLVRKEILAIEVDPRSPERGNYRFVQGLVRTVAYDTLGRRDRKLRHLAAAAYYEAEPDSDDLAGVIASHYLSARDAAPADPDASDLATRAVGLLERAGARATALGSTSEGLRYVRSALELATEPEDRARIASAGATVALAGGELQAAVDLGSLSREVWTELGRPDLAAIAVSYAADALVVLGDASEAKALLDATLATVDGVKGYERATMQLLAAMASALRSLGMTEQSMSCYERSATLAEALSDWPALIRMLNSYGGTLFTVGRPTMGLALITAALELARREQVVGGDILPLNNLVALQLYRDLPTARQRGEEGLAAAQRHGERLNEAWIGFNLAIVTWLDGSWDTVEEIVAESSSGSVRESFIGEMSQLPLAMVRHARGLAFAMPELRVIMGSADLGSRHFAELLEAVVAYEDGRIEQAADLAARGTDGMYALAGIEDDFPLFWVPAVEYAIAAGRTEEARRMLDQVGDTPAGLVPDYLRAQLSRLRGLILAAEGDDAAAEVELRQGAAALLAFGAPFYAARAHLELAELLSRTGRSSEARAEAESAHEAFVTLGATPWVERATVTATLASV